VVRPPPVHDGQGPPHEPRGRQRAGRARRRSRRLRPRGSIAPRGFYERRLGLNWNRARERPGLAWLDRVLQHRVPPRLVNEDRVADRLLAALFLFAFLALVAGHGVREVREAPPERRVTRGDDQVAV